MTFYFFQILTDNNGYVRQERAKSSDSDGKSSGKSSKSDADKRREDKAKSALKALFDTTQDLELSHATSIGGWGGGSGGSGLGLGDTSSSSISSSSDGSSDDYFDSMYNREQYDDRMRQRGISV